MVGSAPTTSLAALLHAHSGMVSPPGSSSGAHAAENAFSSLLGAGSGGVSAFNPNASLARSASGWAGLAAEASGVIGPRGAASLLDRRSQSSNLLGTSAPAAHGGMAPPPRASFAALASLRPGQHAVQQAGMSRSSSGVMPSLLPGGGRLVHRLSPKLRAELQSLLVQGVKVRRGGSSRRDGTAIATMSDHSCCDDPLHCSNNLVTSRSTWCVRFMLQQCASLSHRWRT
jgi:hypothetical protein